MTSSGSINPGRGVGYLADAHPDGQSGGSIDDDSFEFEGTTYTVWQVATSTSTGTQTVSPRFTVATGSTAAVTEFPSANLSELSLRFERSGFASRTFQLSDATYSSSDSTTQQRGYIWRGTQWTLASLDADVTGRTFTVKLLRTVQEQPSLVSNVGQSGASHGELDASDHAQAFTTGTNAAGYRLGGVELRLRTSSGTTTPTVTLREGPADGDGPTVATLSGPASLSGSAYANYTFAPAGLVALEPSTTYSVVASLGGGNDEVDWSQTTANAEDSTPAAGWSIANSYAVRSLGGFDSFSTHVMQMRVRGTIASLGDCPADFVDVGGSESRACFRKVDKVSGSTVLRVSGVSWRDACSSTSGAAQRRHRAERACRSDNSVDYSAEWTRPSVQYMTGTACQNGWLGQAANADCGDGGGHANQGKEWIWTVTSSSSAPALPNTYAARGLVLASNVGRTGTSSTALATTNDLATTFTTGSAAALTSVELRLVSGTDTNPPTVTLHSGSATGTKVATFTSPFTLVASTTRNYTYTLGTPASLAAATTYWVVAEGGGSGVKWSYAGTADEDPTTQPDWGIADAGESRGATQTGSFSTVTDAPYQIRVNGVAESDVWSGTLTAADLGSNALGCSNSVASKECSDAAILRENEFIHGGKSYGILRVSVQSSGRLQVEFSRAPDAAVLGLTLSVDGKLFALSDAEGTGTVRYWDDSGLSWSENDTIDLRLIDLSGALPLKPPPPVVTPVPRTTDSLLVRLIAPENAGRPAITSYDMQYYDFDTEAWVDGLQNITTETVTIGSLPASSGNHFRVRATNANGDGPLSEETFAATFAAPYEVAAWEAFLPSGVGPGDRFRWLYVTSDTYQADEKNYFRYAEDKRGEVVSLSARVHAVVSTRHADARTTTDTTHTESDKGVPIYWFNGAKAADDYADFHDGSWDDEASPKDQRGRARAIAAASQPWTGSANDGTELIVGGVSKALGEDEVGYGALGSTTAGEGPLYSGDTAANTGERPLYLLTGMLFVGDAPLVGNLGQDNDTTDDRDDRRSQRFTTGARAAELDGVGISWWDFDDDEVTVKVFTVDTNGAPDTEHATLTAPSDANSNDDYTVYSAPANTTLAASTTYAVVVAPSTSGADVELATTESDAEDPAGQDDWSIENAFDVESGGSWSADSDGEALRIVVLGRLANNAPTTADRSVTTPEDTAYTFAASDFPYTDGDGDAFASVKVTSLPARGTLAADGAAIASGNTPRTVAKADIDADKLTYTPAANHHGTVTFDFKVSDGIDDSAEAEMTVNITPVNDAPTVSRAIRDQTAAAGSAFSFAFPAGTFTDVDDGTTLTYTATRTNGSALPSWLGFTSGTRTFAGTPQLADIGVLAVRVTADDGDGGTVSDDFDITVRDPGANTPPTVQNPIPGQSATVDHRFDYAFPANTFHDTDADDVLTYTATRADDTALPSWLSFDGGSRAFGGTPTTAETVSVKVTASDGRGGSASTTFSITVNARLNTAPRAAKRIPDQVAFAGRAYSYFLVDGVFEDPDEEDARLIYAATLADGSALPSWLTFVSNVAYEAFEGTPPQSAAGTALQVRVTATDTAGASANADFELRIEDSTDREVDFGTAAGSLPIKVQESTTRHAMRLHLSADVNSEQQTGVTIPIEVTHTGGATAADYTDLPTEVTFAPGATTAEFFIRAVPDGIRESGEGLRLDFGELPTGIRKGTWGPYEIIEFVDEPLRELTVRFGATSYTATEDGTVARVEIKLDAPVDHEPVTVGLGVSYAGGATAADHGTIPANVEFAVGEQTKAVSVSAIDDGVDDDGESVVLSIVDDPDDRVTTGSPGTATVALEDDDGAAEVTVSFGSATYTATEGGADATVSVQLDVAPGRALTVPLTKSNTRGASDADHSGIPASVAFAADETVKTFDVTATSDAPDGGEAVSIGFDTLPAGVFAGSPDTALVNLADGSEQALVVEFGTAARSNPLRVREGRSRFVTMRMDPAPLRAVTVPIVATHTGGASEADHSEIPATVTFDAGKTLLGFNVTAIEDDIQESGEGLRLDIGDLPPGVSKGTWGPYEVLAFEDAPADASVAGALLTLAYPWPLDQSSTPSPRDFVVSARARDGAAATVPVSAVSVDGSVVLLALARAVSAGETVTLSILPAPMHPVRYADGGEAQPAGDLPVRNDTGLPVAGAAAPEGYELPAPLLAALEAARAGIATERLDLSSRRLTDVSALAALTGLRELDLGDNAIADLAPLAGLTGLRALHLGGNAIENAQPLSGLRGLRVLDVSGNRIADPWPLADLGALERLSLAGNRVHDVAALAGLRALRALDLSGNRVADPGPLAGASALERLNLADNGLVRLDALAELDRLRVLDMSGNGVSDLWPLAGLAALERLDLADNRIADAWPLARLDGLRVLLLDGNWIRDVSALSRLGALANLGLAGNRIGDVGVLADLRGLQRLDLSGNAVSDASPLAGLPRLAWLGLRGNPLPDPGALAQPDSLRWLVLDPQAEQAIGARSSGDAPADRADPPPQP